VKRQKDDYKTVDGVTAMIMSIRDAIGGDDNRDWYEDNEIEFI